MKNKVRESGEKTPRHIAIIMDGNGRWARGRGMSRLLGHRSAITAVRDSVETCSRLGVEVLTLYAFSTENWSRPKSEVNGLMSLLKQYIDAELPRLMETGVRLCVVGDIDRFPERTRTALLRAVERTAGNGGLVLNLALNYGGRQEIVRAVNRLIAEGCTAADEAAVERHLYTAGLPDPDLIIRTSGELRLSNFLLWQAAYAEFYFTPVLWPDFSAGHLHEAIEDYRRRSRRYGGV